MPLADCPWSINCHGLSEVWFVCHNMPLRQGDFSFIQTQVNSWLFADQLEKPQETVKFRSKEHGGLGLQNIPAKSLSMLIRSFLETALDPQYIRSPYHQALYMWYVDKNYHIPQPPKSPYYTDDFFESIQRLSLIHI